VGCFGGHGLPKAPQQPGQPAEIPLQSVRTATAEWPERLKRLASGQKVAI